MLNGKQVIKALQDFKGAFTHWQVWVMLGWQDIRLRYRRSMLGPFWLTISMAVTIYTMGFLYGHLFKMELQTYFPYLATGILSWNLLSTILIESTDIFTQSESYIKQVKLPYFTYVFRMVFRNFVIFLHNFMAFIPLIFIFHITVSWHSLIVLPALLLVAFNAAVYGAIIAIIGTRYRDIAPIIISLIQVIFFLTPIMWMPNLLPERYQFAVHYNPFAQFINLLRYPLLGQPVPADIINMVVIFSLLGVSILFVLFTKYRSRIVFWI